MENTNTSIPQGEIQESPALKKQRLEHFKSLYYFFKSKRDTDIKLFDDFKQFRKRDIEELNSLICNKINIHKCLTTTSNVTIGLDNGEILPFGTWESFMLHDWNTAATTKYISIEWDFNLLLENQYDENIPQTHTVRVRMGNGLKPSEMIQVLFQGGEEHELEEARSQMVCKIDFVNAQICTEIKDIVNRWYQSLPKNSSEQKLIPILAKNSQKLRQLITTLIILSGVILCQGIFKVYFLYENSPTSSKDELFLFFKLFTYSIVILYMFYVTGRFYSDRIMRKTVNRFKRYPMFEFTKGDENMEAQIKSKNSKLITQLFWGIVISILANGATVGISELLKLIK
jgi:hypothetical protein